MEIHLAYNCLLSHRHHGIIIIYCYIVVVHHHIDTVAFLSSHNMTFRATVSHMSAYVYVSSCACTRVYYVCECTSITILKHSITIKYYHNGTINHILVDIRDTVNYRDHETVHEYVYSYCVT